MAAALTSETIIMSHPQIHLSVPHMSGLEQEYIAAAFASNWLSTVGPNLVGFEDEVSRVLGGRPTLAVASGTAALHLALREVGIGQGDEVALSTLTFAGSLYPIMYLGARPVFIDSERESWNMSPAQLAAYLDAGSKRGRLPKAVIVVHLYGQHADLDAIASLCAQYDVPLIEDAAESLGAFYRGRPTGTVGHHAILSFNGNKIITTTGGGMVVSKDPAAIQRMKKWANQSREPAIEYVHHEIGYNYRMSNVLAGIGRGQLRVLDQRVAQRRAIFEGYRDAFATLTAVSPQPEAPWGTHTRWLSVFLVEPSGHHSARGLIKSLTALNIESRPVWRPMHTQPLVADAPRWGGEIAEDLCTRGICLPSSSSLAPVDQERVIDAVCDYFNG